MRHISTDTTDIYVFNTIEEVRQSPSIRRNGKRQLLVAKDTPNSGVSCYGACTGCPAHISTHPDYDRADSFYCRDVLLYYIRTRHSPIYRRT